MWRRSVGLRAVTIVSGGPIGLTNLAAILAAAAVLTVTAYWRFNRRDLQANALAQFKSFA
jgi:predicted ATPase